MAQVLSIQFSQTARNTVGATFLDVVDILWHLRQTGLIE